MTTITLTFHDGEEDRFKRTLFAEEAWNTMHKLDALVRLQLKNGDASNDNQTLHTVRDVLGDVLWRVE